MSCARTSATLGSRSPSSRIRTISSGDVARRRHRRSRRRPSGACTASRAWIGDPAGQVTYAADRTVIHLADAFKAERTILNPPTPRIRIHQHLDPGQGEIDLNAVAAALGRADFRGLLTVQVFAWPDRAEASFAATRSAAQQFVELLEAARGA
jgi:sugar phosphate isomerase/epimerase